MVQHGHPGGAGQAASAYIVEGYTNDHDFVAFGGCYGSGTSYFCCTLDEDTETAVSKIVLQGTDDDDEVLSFSYVEGPATWELAPNDTDMLVGQIFGGDGNDNLYGSDYAGSGYEERLDGEDGPDSLHGGDGDDLLRGGKGADSLYGGGGADIVHGGLGDDGLYGEGGADTLCDFTGITGTCATDGLQVMVGGTGNDQAWYNESAACTNRKLDLTLSDLGGQASDAFGDENDWTNVQRPRGYFIGLTSEPAECAAP